MGPEMKSTGEVLGIGETVYEALYKGLVAANVKIPRKAKVLVSISDVYKEEFLPIARELYEMEFMLIGTKGTTDYLNSNGIPCSVVNKLGEGTPDILDLVNSGEVGIIINTPTKGRGSLSDGFKIRRAAIENGITCLTSIDTARAISDIIKRDIKPKDLRIVHLEEYTREIS